MQLEVCLDSVAAAVGARQQGATRVELCAALEIGGITPSAGLIEQAVASCGIPVHVMIRPRGGNFVFSDDERAIMLRDIALAGSLGAAAVVIGQLTPSGQIDLPGTATLIDAARRHRLVVTFHRAFDLCPDPLPTLNTLIDLGVDHLLTSGQATTAWEGRDLLGQLVREANGRIRIIAAAGIHADNAREVAASGVDALHFSARRREPDAAGLRFGSDWSFDHQKVQAIREVCLTCRKT